MELTPKLLTEDVDFRVAYRGYDRDEVDDFLERVAVAVGQLQQQLGEAVNRARSAESRLKASGGAAPASATSTPAPPEAAPAPVQTGETEDLNEELRRTLVLAQRTADAAVREAREQAAQIQSDAEERAQRAMADAEAGARRKADEARTKLLAEIAELEGIRESMRGDVSVLERHLEEQRLQLRSSFQELQRLLDDPTSFRISPTPPLSGVVAPSPARELSEPPRAPAKTTPAPPATPSPASASPAAAAPASASPASGSASAAAVPSAPAPARPAEAARTAERAEQGSATSGTAPETAAAQGSPAPAEPSQASEASSGPPSGSVSFGEGAAPASGRAAEVSDPGPRTQPVAAARFEEEDNDAFLAELRKAMADEADSSQPERDATLFDQDDRARGRPRFGRRR